MAVDNRQAVADALGMLGYAWRLDWSDFDGRTLRTQLDDLAGALTADGPFDVGRWAVANGICPEVRTWSEHCNERSKGVGRYECDHQRAVFEEH